MMASIPQSYPRIVWRYFRFSARGSVAEEPEPEELGAFSLVGDQERPVAGHVEQGQFLVAGDTLARRVAAKVGNADRSAELLLA